MDDASSHTRQRLVTWDDPRASLAEGMRLDGDGYLQAMIAGEIPRPPIASLMGFELEEAGQGRAVFVAQPGEEHYNPMGVVHGGLAASLIDSATGCAIQSLLPRGEVITTVDLRVTFVRPLGGDGGAVRCEGTVVHRGRSTAMAEAKVTDGEGRLIAYGGATCRIVKAATEAR